MLQLIKEETHYIKTIIFLHHYLESFYWGTSSWTHYLTVSLLRDTFSRQDYWTWSPTILQMTGVFFCIRDEVFSRPLHSQEVGFDSVRVPHLSFTNFRRTGGSGVNRWFF